MTTQYNTYQLHVPLLSGPLPSIHFYENIVVKEILLMMIRERYIHCEPEKIVNKWVKWIHNKCIKCQMIYIII